MVARLATAVISAQRMAAETAQPLIQRLDPATRAKVLATLAGLIILGVALMLLAWLGGRAAKRYMNYGSPKRRPALDENDWATKPLIPKDDAEEP